MTDTNITPNGAPTPAVSTLLSHYITWLRAHEKLLLVAVGAFLFWHVYTRGLQSWDAHDQRQAQIAANQVLTDHTANQAVQAQLTQLTTAVKRQQTVLDGQITLRGTQNTSQKVKDAQMTSSDLAARFQGLLKIKPEDVQSIEPTGNLVFTPAGSQAGIDALEDLQTCRGDLADTRTELTGQEQLVAKQTDALTGSQKELADERVSHQKDVKVANDKAKHSFWKGFKIGVVVGVVGTEAVHIWAGRP